MIAYRICTRLLLFAMTLSVVGCGSSGGGSSSSGGGSMDEMAAAVDQQNAARKQAADAAAAKTAADQKAAEAAAATQPPAEPEKRIVGRPPVEGGGYYSAIAGANRHVRNVVDSLPWKDGVRLFRATEGRKPKDHAEFMKKIIEAQQIPLPHKEEDEEFLYDPNGETDGDFGQLYIVKKADSAAK